MADGLKEGKDALAVVREKLIDDMKRFDADRREAEAVLSRRSSELDAREREVRDQDISLDIREADVLEKEGALEDRLSFVTSCQE